MVSSCCLQLIKHDKKLRKTVENSLNALLRIESELFIDTFRTKLFQKCVNRWHSSKRSRLRQGKDYEKFISKLPFYDFAKLSSVLSESDSSD